MKDIMSALEQVRQREEAAALLVEEARRGARERVAAADEAGREDYRKLVAAAEEEARERVAAAETEAEAMKAGLREETEKALKRLDKAGKGLFEEAVKLLLKECEKAYGPDGPGYGWGSGHGA